MRRIVSHLVRTEQVELGGGGGDRHSMQAYSVTAVSYFIGFSLS